MSEYASRPHLAIIEVTASRPDRPAYHAKVQTLNERVATVGRDGGWTVSRHPAADTTPAALLAATAGADAIVLVGGEDLTPHFYGAEAGYEGETIHFEQADAGQIAIVRRALSLSTPLLGICRGLQVINVALGGTLVQHIEDDGFHKNLNVPIDQILATHAVTLAKDSGLADSLGATDVLVQSAHHQSVDRLGHGLVPAAVAPDGLVEALEHVSAPITGVQWHPEAPDAPAAQLALLLDALQRQVTPVAVLATAIA